MAALNYKQRQGQIVVCPKTRCVISLYTGGKHLLLQCTGLVSSINIHTQKQAALLSRRQPITVDNATCCKSTDVL